MKLPTFEAGIYQVLGPKYPTDPLYNEWGFGTQVYEFICSNKGPKGLDTALNSIPKDSKMEKNYICLGVFCSKHSFTGGRQNNKC